MGLSRHKLGRQTQSFAWVLQAFVLVFGYRAFAHAAESKLPVDWSGPNYRGDWMAIIPVGSAENAFGGFYAYSKKGTPATLSAPKDPGTYEIRYVLKGKRVIARRPIAITAP